MTASLEDVLGRGSFDFVIVGGGTCGLTLAARLTEDPELSVLVIEAGSANLDDPKILTPGLWHIHFNDPRYDWGFTTVEQENLAGRKVYFPRGKGLGGSSAINFFQYHRPAKADIDAFETLGNPGWNWNLLKKYYMKAETFIPPQIKHETMSFDVNERGSNGPLAYGYALTLSNLERPYHEALSKVGITRADEPFSGETNGTWLTTVSIDPINRVRSYAANMYYQPNAARPNLTVLVSAHVKKLILKHESGAVTADRVRFVHGGKDYEISVAKEVILCAGAIMSPQILELSGIGSPEVLTKAGIDVNVTLPGVGENVQEHIHSESSYEIRKDKEDAFKTFDCLSDPAVAAQQFAEYKLHGTGICGMAPICITTAPLVAISPEATSLTQSLKDWVQAEVASGKLSAARQKQLTILLSHIADQEPECELILTQTFNSKPNMPKPGYKHITVNGHINHPISRGTIHVKSNDPMEAPVIDPRYFESDYDLQVFIEMFKFNRRLVQQEPLRSILSGIEVNPGPECQTDEQIAGLCDGHTKDVGIQSCTDWLKAHFNSTWHTVGSCSMLPLEDGGVVDTKLKVYNTTNIRVVDISIIPLHIGAHTQATAYALGELGVLLFSGWIFWISIPF
ncbi:alcohol oxidase [Mycena leptocephala]|nr:alcohol oxidase [Mycena leptocephala]